MRKCWLCRQKLGTHRARWCAKAKAINPPELFLILAGGKDTKREEVLSKQRLASLHAANSDPQLPPTILNATAQLRSYSVLIALYFERWVVRGSAHVPWRRETADAAFYEVDSCCFCFYGGSLRQASNRQRTCESGSHRHMVAGGQHDGPSRWSQHRFAPGRAAFDNGREQWKRRARERRGF